jgi:hypothetical protein
MKPLLVTGLPAFLAVLGVAPLSAQSVISAKSGLLSFVEGQVFLNDQPVEYSTTRFPDVKENAIVRTQDGRAEVLLTPGVTLRLAENSSLKMITNRLIDTRVELLSGSAVVEADDIAKDTAVTIIDKNGVVSLPKAGIYRFDVEPAQVKVFKGVASVEDANGGEAQQVSSGRMLALSGGAAATEKFDTEDTDALDRWSHRRGSYLAMANASAAKSLASSGYMPIGWGMANCTSAWGFNPYLGMMTYIPCNGSLWSPYGYQFWSPYAIGMRYWINPPLLYGGGGGRTIIASSPSGSASLARPAASRSAAAMGGFAGAGAHGIRGAGGAYSAANSGANAGFAGSRNGGFSNGGFSGGGFSGASAVGGGFSGGGGMPAGAGGGGGAHGASGGGGGHH